MNRQERDTFGLIDVNNDRLWGAQTQRSLHHFSIGVEHFPRPLIRAFGVLKQAAAETMNGDVCSTGMEKSLMEVLVMNGKLLIIQALEQ